MYIEWRCKWSVKQRFDELVDYLQTQEEYSDEYTSTLGEIRSLPSFPYGYEEERDVIVPVVVKGEYSGDRRIRLHTDPGRPGLGLR